MLGLLHSVQNFLQILINPYPSSHSFFQLSIGTLLLVVCVADSGNDSEDVPLDSCSIILTSYFEFAFKTTFSPLP